MSTYPGPVPAGIADLVRSMVVREPTRPRLTWYGPEGERVELSGRVLDNWVAKTANLLIEEFDAGPGTRIGVALPTHWRAATWMLAIWSVGACAVVAPSPGAAPHPLPDPSGTATALAAWITDRPDGGATTTAAAGGAIVVAVALPALARDFGPGLPDAALDAAAEVRIRADVFIPPVLPVPGDPALVLPGGATLTHGDLVSGAHAAADRMGLPGGVRLLTDVGTERAVDGLLAPWCRDGSVVLHHDLTRLTGPERERLAEAERTTAVLLR